MTDVKAGSPAGQSAVKMLKGEIRIDVFVGLLHINFIYKRK